MQSGRTAFVLFIHAASYPFRKGSFGSLFFSMTEASISANPCRYESSFRCSLYSYYPPPFGYDTYTFRFTARAQARQAVLSAFYNL